MPEMPDIELYLSAVGKRVIGRTLDRLRVKSPFLVRSVDPPLESCEGKKVLGLRRLGKRIVFEIDSDLFLILHLMIAGRLHWKIAPPKLSTKNDLASFEFSSGSLLLTEASPKKRASLFLVAGESALAHHNPGGIDVLHSSFDLFHRKLTEENRTLKRALTDPRRFSGIGNAYSDEILHAAGLSPLAQTQKLTAEQSQKLFDATQNTLANWINRLLESTGLDFPEKVTAFRPEMAVHGKFGKPCPVCNTKVERIVYADNECNYCPRCQTNGKRLADRLLSRLLKDDWPREIDEEEGY